MLIRVHAVTTGPIDIARPGMTIDSRDMHIDDLVLVRWQPRVPQNGVYQWRGHDVPLHGPFVLENGDLIEGMSGKLNAGRNFKQAFPGSYEPVVIREPTAGTGARNIAAMTVSLLVVAIIVYAVFMHWR